MLPAIALSSEQSRALPRCQPCASPFPRGKSPRNPESPARICWHRKEVGMPPDFPPVGRTARTSATNPDSILTTKQGSYKRQQLPPQAPVDFSCSHRFFQPNQSPPLHSPSVPETEEKAPQGHGFSESGQNRAPFRLFSSAHVSTTTPSSLSCSIMCLTRALHRSLSVGYRAEILRFIAGCVKLAWILPRIVHRPFSAFP